MIMNSVHETHPDQANKFWQESGWNMKEIHQIQADYRNTI